MKEKSAFQIVLTSILMPFLLCTCFAPEDFDVNINIDKNGKLKFSYNGLLVHLTARKAFVAKGEIDKKIEEEVMKFHQNFSKDKRFKTVTYVGGGQLKASYEYDGDLEGEFHFLNVDDNFFSIVPKSDRRVEFSCYRVRPSTAAGLAEAQVKIRGKVTVTTEARVLGHNAASAPEQPGAPGAYRWEIKAADDPTPYLLLQLAGPPGK